ncbi:TPA: hypothetical protein ACPZHN_004158 [Providencia stuartii]
MSHNNDLDYKGNRTSTEKIYTLLINNYDRVANKTPVRMVKLGFMLSDKHIENNQEEGKLLKKLLRKYLNYYRKCSFKKHVLGYSWVVMQDNERKRPYVHITFYVTQEFYDQSKPSPDSSIKTPVSAFKALTEYWMTICSSDGRSGMWACFHIDRIHESLGEGDLKWIKFVNTLSDAYQLDINNKNIVIPYELSESEESHMALLMYANTTYPQSIHPYFYALANATFFIPNQRMFGYSS